MNGIGTKKGFGLILECLAMRAVAVFCALLIIFSLAYSGCRSTPRVSSAKSEHIEVNNDYAYLPNGDMDLRTPQSEDEFIAEDDTEDLRLSLLAYINELQSITNNEYPSPIDPEEVLVEDLVQDEGSLTDLSFHLFDWEAEMEDYLTNIPEIAEKELMDSPHAYPMELVYNREVRDVIRSFTGVKRKAIARALKRSGKYMNILLDILYEHGMPADLVWLVLIESGFRDRVYSWANARGLWQFIAPTGQRYGLKIDWWVDERCDPIKSTHSACKYLKELYDYFGSWELALASYNGGENRTKRCVRVGQTEDFWELRERRFFKAQTRHYVPAFYAAAIIGKDPESFGFDIDYDEPMVFDEVEVCAFFDLETAARCAGTSLDVIRLLNPELRRWCTPGNVESYTLRIPKGKKDRFLAEYSKIPKNKITSFKFHKVRWGETLISIARRYHTSVEAIQAANNIYDPRSLRAGKTIIIPAGPLRYDKRQYSSKSYKSTKNGGNNEARVIRYRVRKGDSIYKIARKFGVSQRQIIRWNNLYNRKYIYPGEYLVIYR